MSRYKQKKSASIARRLWLQFTVVVFAFGMLLAGYAYTTTQGGLADTQFSKTPRGVRVGHLVSDPVAGRMDYVFRARSFGDGNASTILAYAPGGTLLFSIPPDPNQPIQQLIDVTDLDGDGNAEIVGVFTGSASFSAAVWIYNGDGSLRRKFEIPLGMGLGFQSVKTYGVFPANGQKRIVVVPDTSTITNPGTVNIYFLDSSGNIIAQPSVPPNATGLGGENLIFPGVAVGSIDNSGANQILVLAFARVLVFDQNGAKWYYKQFVDPTGTFTNYVHEKDIPVGSTLTLRGRRYGMFALVDVDANGDLELVIAGDKVNKSDTIPGPVYEAYDLPTGPDSGEFLGGSTGNSRRLWQVWLPNSQLDIVPAGTLPADSGYTVGVPLNGIQDANADTIYDIIVTDTDPNTRAPFIRAINTRTGELTGSLINGICLDVRILDTGEGVRLRDLIVYDPATQVHSVWRFNQGTYTPVQLSGTTIGLAGSTRMVGQSAPDNFSLSDAGTTGLTTADGHFQVMATKSNAVRAFVGYTRLCCPSGLAGWTTQGGTLQQSLNMSPRTGQVVNVTPVTDLGNSVWIMNLESGCGILSDVVRTYTQSGSSLVATGDFGLPAPAYQGRDDGAGCDTIEGWAWDANNPNGTVSVDIYDGDTFIGTAPCNMYREDLLNALGSPYHGFSFYTPASLRDGAPHSVSVKFSGTNTLLWSSPRTIQCSLPINLQGAHDGVGCNSIVGWAWDSNDPNGTVNVDVYNGTTLIGTVNATQYRQDLADLFGSPYHGFAMPMPASLRDGQPHTITVKFGGTNTNLWNTPKTFTCTSSTTNFQGSLDVADCNTISGYAWDANDDNTTVEAAIYSDGSFLVVIPAQQVSPGIGNGYHGYKFAVPASLKNGQPHSITVKISGTCIALANTPKTITCSQ